MNIKETIRKNLRILLEKKGDTHDYGCAMLKLEIPKKEWDDLQSMIDDDDIYTEEGDRSFGREDEPHITLLYGLHNDIPDEDIEEVSKKMEKCEVNLKKISIFENEKFDVLKFDIIDDSKKELSKMNKEFAKFPHTTDYPDYHPHATLCYLKKGMGKKYIQTLSEDDEITIECDTIIYSKADGTKLEYQLQSI
jgi:2'-5' RNA ligase